MNTDEHRWRQPVPADVRSLPGWTALETVHSCATIPAVWRVRLEQLFESFSRAFLERTCVIAQSYPCPVGCGCVHEVIQHAPDDIVAACRCEAWCCDDIPLTAEELVIWRLDWARLSRSLSQAFGLRPKLVPLNLNQTFQVGSWGTDAVPVILTIQHTSSRFQETLHALSARLRHPFILLAPTANHLTASAQEVLTSLGAGFFSLESVVRLTPSGTLRAITVPGQLLARFTGPPKEPLQEDVARRAFALVEQLDSEQPLKAPTVLTVFRLYCMEEKSAAEVARRCKTSKATVIRRLELIRARTGLDPRDIRRVSSHLNSIEDDLADSRAAHIQRRRLIYDDAEEGGE